MVGVGEDDLRVGPGHVTRAQPPHDAVRADRHEGRRLDPPVRQAEGAGARGPLGGIETELEHQGSEVSLSGAKDRVGGASDPGHPGIQTHSNRSPDPSLRSG